jgi:uncharacterized membrane protein YidH (DUF202 family)
MPGRLILTLSASALFISGMAALFAPDEIARLLDSVASSSLPVVIQLIGGSLLGFALLNWMSRRNRIGGVYARPIGLGNLMFFTTAALTLGKAASKGHLPLALMAAGSMFGLLAASFAWLVFAHDPVSQAVKPAR